MFAFVTYTKKAIRKKQICFWEDLFLMDLFGGRKRLRKTKQRKSLLLNVLTIFIGTESQMNSSYCTKKI
jgi:hypothetical protein